MATTTWSAESPPPVVGDDGPVGGLSDVRDHRVEVYGVAEFGSESLGDLVRPTDDAGLLRPARCRQQDFEAGT